MKFYSGHRIIICETFKFPASLTWHDWRELVFSELAFVGFPVSLLSHRTREGFCFYVSVTICYKLFVQLSFVYIVTVIIINVFLIISTL